MEATRVIKTIETTTLDELSSYVGQQVEIIIWPIKENVSITADDDLETRKIRFFQMIDQHAGPITPWTREELYER